MKLRIRHNLSDAQLQKALVGLASSNGIEAAVADALLKATGCSCEESEPRDPATRHIYQQFRKLFVEAQSDIKRSAERLLRGSGLIKAQAPVRPLTKEELAELLQAIRDRFGLIVGQMQSDYIPTPAELARWKSQGWVAGDVTPEDFALTVTGDAKLIHNAFLVGRAWKAMEAGGTFAEVMRQAMTMPLLAPDLHAIAVAEQQTANYITAFGDDVAKMAGEMAARKARDVVRDMAVQFHGQRLQARVLDRQSKEQAGLTIPDKLVDTWRGFSSELYHAMEDKSRDWDRVAQYEITDAQKQGQAMQIMADHGPKQLVYKMPMPTACPQCKHAYLEEDGTPKVFDLAQLVANGTNIGRKAHPVRGGKVVPGGRPDGAEALKPVAGLVHNFCQCMGPYPFTGHEPWARQRRNRMDPTLAKAEGSHQKTVCIDFDGVIADYSQGFLGQDKFGDPLPGAAEVTQRLKGKGWKVIIFTTRAATPILQSYLTQHGIAFDSINHNSEQPEGANPGKPIADAYLDDRAIRFSNWAQAERDLQTLVKSSGRVCLLAKAHVKQYTRQDGTVVAEHDDKRQKKAAPAKGGQNHHEQFVALLRKNRPQKATASKGKQGQGSGKRGPKEQGVRISAAKLAKSTHTGLHLLRRPEEKPHSRRAEHHPVLTRRKRPDA